MRGAGASIDSFLRQRREVRADLAKCPSSGIFDDRCREKRETHLVQIICEMC